MQKAFARGELQSGTYKEITPKEKTVNDISGLEAKLKQFSHASLSWLERLDVTIQPASQDGGEEEEEDNVQDDFKRELNL